MLESISKGEGETVNVGEVIGTIGEGEGNGAAPPSRNSAPKRKSSRSPEQDQVEQPEAEAEEVEETTNGHREVEDGGFAPRRR